MKPELLAARHPQYLADSAYWEKWRKVASGGDSFVRAYLVRQPDEKPNAFIARCDLSPAISYVQMALNEIIAAFYVRMPGVTRVTKESIATSYIQACNGQNNGIDGCGSTMNQYMATVILRELLTVKRVGIYVDRPILPQDVTIDVAKSNPPYIYAVKAENILAWTISPGRITPTELLLRECVDVTVEGTTLVTGYVEQFRHLKLTENGVAVTSYSDKGDLINQQLLNLSALPFVLLEIDGPVVKDVTNAQIALLNLESSSVTFAIDSNLAVYTEQGDMSTLMAALRRATPVDKDATSDEDEDVPGTESDVMTIRLGRNRGRRYLLNSDRPDFVSPDNSNLQRSLALAGQLKEDIRRVMLLAIANIAAKSITSATALIQGQITANNGLSIIGALLEQAERIISLIWGEFEQEDTALVQYPVDFQILTDAERRKAIDELTELRDTVPSRTYQEQITRQIAQLLLSNSVSVEMLRKVYAEIAEAPSLISKITDVVAVVEADIMPREYAGKCLCLPADAAEKGNREHADRLQRMAAAQTATGTARGNTDGVDDAKNEKTLTQDADTSDTGRRATRQ